MVVNGPKLPSILTTLVMVSTMLPSPNDANLSPMDDTKFLRTELKASLGVTWKLLRSFGVDRPSVMAGGFLGSVVMPSASPPLTNSGRLPFTVAVIGCTWSREAVLERSVRSLNESMPPLFEAVFSVMPVPRPMSRLPRRTPTLSMPSPAERLIGGVEMLADTVTLGLFVRKRSERIVEGSDVSAPRLRPTLPLISARHRRSLWPSPRR